MSKSSYPPKGIGIPLNINEPHELVDARNPASKPAKLQSAIEGNVLVKNINNALPLKAPKMLSLFGYNAHVPLVNNHNPFTGGQVGRWYLGLQSMNQSDSQLGSIFAAGFGRMPNSASRGHIISGGGSGAATPSYISTPYEAFSQQAHEDDTFLLWDFQSLAPNVNPASDACLVFINEFAVEASDRPSLADSESDTLVRSVARKCKNTIVIIHNAGIRLVDAWIDNSNVTALIFAHLPGQDSGRALVQVVYGKQSPSGRLPYTVAKRETDYGNLAGPSTSLSSTEVDPQSKFQSNL